MPVLVLTVSEDLDKLLQDGSLATTAALGELCRVVVVAVDLALMLVVAILGTKHSWAQRTGEVVDMILAVQGCDI